MNKVLAVFGGGPGSLGDNFLNWVSTKDEYRRIINFSLPQVDCTNDNTMRSVASQTSEWLSRDDELHCVNFVGMMDNGKILEYSVERFQRVMEVNLTTLFHIAHNFIPLLTSHNGKFVTIGSNAGEQGFTGMAAYCSSKFAVQGFIQCMAKELAPFNVPVNVVNPGAFSPESSLMSEVQVEQFKETTGKSDEEIIEMLTSRIPMKRLATNADLNQVLFALLNMYPRFYTGQAVSLSGGQVM